MSPPPPLDRRIAVLEEQVNALNELPARVGAVEVQLVDLRRDLTTLRDEVRSEFGALRGEIRSGDEETRRQMRVLHEEVISRIALIQEGLAPSRPGSGRSSRRRRPKHR